MIAATIGRVAGDYAEPAEQVPRHCAPEFRRPRFVHYKARLNAKLWRLHVWWLIAGAWIVVEATSHIAACAAQAGGSLDRFSECTLGPDLTSTIAAVAGLPACALNFSQCAVRVETASGVLRLLHVALRAATTAAVVALPLLLAACAAHAVFCCSARERSGRMTAAEAHWLWPHGQSGEAPWQRLPPTLTGESRSDSDSIRQGAATVNGTPSAMRGASARRRGQMRWAATATSPPTSLPSGQGLPELPPHTPPLARDRADGIGTASALSPRARAAADSSGLAIPYEYPDSAAVLRASGWLADSSDDGAGDAQPPRLQLRLSSPPSPAVPPAMDAPLQPRGLRIVILTIGTRGDVQPYIALATSLAEAGHSVAISSTDDHAALVESSGVEFVRVGAGRIEQSPMWLHSSTRTVADMVRLSAPYIGRAYPVVSSGFSAAVAGGGPERRRRADVIIGTGHTLSMAHNIGEAMSLPVWTARLSPDLPTAAIAPPGQHSSSYGLVNIVATLNFWLSLAVAAGRHGLDAAESAHRASLGLPAKLAFRAAVERLLYTPCLLGWSAYLLPRPTDYMDWVFQTGFWVGFDDPSGLGARLPAGVREWLDRPPRSARPLAVVTFGSMLNADLGAVIAGVLRGTNFDVLVITGWQGEAFGDVPHPPPPVLGVAHADMPRVLCVRELPHGAIFRRAAVVLHHGGAGTTARALACGVPSVIIPVLRWSDQVTWGDAVEATGVGVAVRDTPATAEDVSKALERVLRGDFRVAPFTGSIIGDRANALGAFVRAQRSCDAVRVALESCLCNMALPPAEADAVHPFRLDAAAVRDSTILASLSAAQRMCVRHCIPCHILRCKRAASAADTALAFSTPPQSGTRATTTIATVAAATEATSPLSRRDSPHSSSPRLPRSRARSRETTATNAIRNASPLASPPANGVLFRAAPQLGTPQTGGTASGFSAGRDVPASDGSVGVVTFRRRDASAGRASTIRSSSLRSGGSTGALADASRDDSPTVSLRRCVPQRR